jgi:hypothetical protein
MCINTLHEGDNLDYNDNNINGDDYDYDNYEYYNLASKKFGPLLSPFILMLPSVSSKVFPHYCPTQLVPFNDLEIVSLYTKD